MLAFDNKETQNFRTELGPKAVAKQNNERMHPFIFVSLFLDKKLPAYIGADIQDIYLFSIDPVYRYRLKHLCYLHQ